jgi:hypothetical protein
MSVIFFFAYFAAISSLLSLNVSRSVIDDYINSANNFKEKTELLDIQNSLKKEVFIADSTILIYSKPLFEKIEESAVLVNDKISDIKKKLIIDYSGNSNELLKTSIEINLLKIQNKDASVYIDIYELNTGLINFRNTVKQAIGNVKIEKSTISKLVNTYENEDIDWKEPFLKREIFISAWNELNMLQYQISLTKYMAFCELK